MFRIYRAHYAGTSIRDPWISKKLYGVNGSGVVAIWMTPSCHILPADLGLKPLACLMTDA